MITLAKYAGFCFGVKRAVDTVYDIVRQNSGGKIYTLGKLIHNPTVVSELEQKGVRVIDKDDFEDIYNKARNGEKCTVIIRTHGVSKQLSTALAHYSEMCEDFKVCDLTCPYVKKIHNIVSDAPADCLTLIFGDEKHPEVEGIKSFAVGQSIVFSDSVQLKSILSQIDDSSKCIIMVSQTTQNLSEWRFCQEMLRNLYTNAKIFDTICSVTENRQTEAATLSQNVDTMVVIGGRNSSNTTKLFDTAQSRCPRTYHIENAAEAANIPINIGDKIGITAGASTPDSIIQEVIKLMSNEMEIKAEESFEQMLDETFKTLNTGDVVSGVITSISTNEIHVDLGMKYTGILTYDNITDDPTVKLDEVYKVGDTVEAVAVRVSDIDGVATLSKKKIDAKNNWAKIVKASEEDAILTGKYIGVVKGGMMMLIDGVKVFVPASHTTVRRDGDLSVLVGKTAEVKIIELDDQRRRAKASERNVIREARRAAESKFWDEMEVGKVFEGPVKSLTSYGAFIDLGSGIDGMVHSSELSWRRIKHPSEIVNVGDIVRVFVKDFDREKRRIALGYKTEESNPWTIFTSQCKKGDIVTVTIVNMMPFGAFAEIIPGADGLIHISQIADRKINKPSDVLEIGQQVDAKIIDINEEKHEINLSIRALLEEADEEIEDTAEDAVVYSDEAGINTVTE